MITSTAIQMDLDSSMMGYSLEQLLGTTYNWMGGKLIFFPNDIASTTTNLIEADRLHSEAKETLVHGKSYYSAKEFMSDLFDE